MIQPYIYHYGHFVQGMDPYPVGMVPYPVGMDSYPLGMDSYPVSFINLWIFIQFICIKFKLGMQIMELLLFFQSDDFLLNYEKNFKNKKSSDWKNKNTFIICISSLNFIQINWIKIQRFIKLTGYGSIPTGYGFVPTGYEFIPTGYGSIPGTNPYPVTKCP